MVSLIWKEARERLLWGLVLTLISGYAAWTRGYTFYGDPGLEMVNRSVGPILMAFLLGASSYASELTSRRAVFLLTRPVSWRGVLASKLLVSLAVLFAAAAVAAAAYVVGCPEAYRPHVVLPVLLRGAGWALVLTTAGYFVGLSCSSVLAGAAESAVFAILQGTILIYLFNVAAARWGVWWQMMPALWPAPLLLAGLVVARFGLTLSAGERLRRYLIAASAGTVLLGAVVYCVPESFIDEVISSRLNQEHITWSISPDGLYAFGRDMKYLYWLDVRKDKLTRLENVYEDYSGLQVILENVGWMGPHTPYRLGYGRDDWFIRKYSTDGGRVEHQDMPMGKLTDGAGFPSGMSTSPDGRTAVISLSAGMGLPQRLVCADVAAGRKLKSQAKRAAGTPVWWESPDRFGFITPRNETRHLTLNR